jgi:hypothetical protein
MNTALLTSTLPSPSTATLTGTWKLAAGRAIGLQPREDAVLRVAHGCMWVTFDGPHAGALNALGDIFLGAGEHITVPAGQHVVVESMGGKQPVPAYFGWEPAASMPRHSAWQAGRLQLAVVQPLADLRGALVLALAAVGRLGAGVFGLATCAFNAQAKACRAHGAMSSGDSIASSGAL